jgi:hypothetical protein
MESPEAPKCNYIEAVRNVKNIFQIAAINGRKH